MLSSKCGMQNNGRYTPRPDWKFLQTVMESRDDLKRHVQHFELKSTAERVKDLETIVGMCVSITMIEIDADTRSFPLARSEDLMMVHANEIKDLKTLVARYRDILEKIKRTVVTGGSGTAGAGGASATVTSVASILGLGSLQGQWETADEFMASLCAEGDMEPMV